MSGRQDTIWLSCLVKLLLFLKVLEERFKLIDPRVSLLVLRLIQHVLESRGIVHVEVFVQLVSCPFSIGLLLAFLVRAAIDFALLLVLLTFHLI